MSSNAADEAHGNGTTVGPRTSTQLLVWSLTNTRSLNGDEPEPHLSHGYLRVGRYSMPPPSEQKVGSVPLVDCLNNKPCSKFLTGIVDPFVESESPLDSNDTRMQQVTFADGKLWGALDTALTINGVNKAAIEAAFGLAPSAVRVVAGDVYSVPPHTGRGGWSWYTGSAGWMYRAGLESILGLRRRGATFVVDPCIPSTWTEYQIAWRFLDTRYEITVSNPDRRCRGVFKAELDGVAADPMAIPLVDDGGIHQVRVVLGSA